MKKLLIGLAVIIVLVIVAVIAAPALIPVETYKEQIAQAAREATGRELRIDGDLSVSIVPRLEVEVEDVAFANAPGAATSQMATLKAMRVQLEVLPLISGEVQVNRFVLVEPVINLEIDENGRGNWDFALAGMAAAAAQEAPKSAPAGGSGSDPMAMLQQIRLDDVRLVDGRVTFRDARSGESQEISDIQMTVSLPDMDSPVGAEGSLMWNGERLAINLGSENLRGLVAGARTPLRLALESRPVTVTFDGQVAPAGAPQLTGRVDLDVPSIRGLADWAGSPLEAGGTGLGPLKIAGQVAAGDGKVAFTEARISLDDINAQGDLSADTGGAKPVLVGRLDVDAINLNTYMPAPAGQPAQGEGTGATAPAPAPAGEQPQAAAGWSEEPILLDGLRAANVDFDLTVGAIQVQNVKIGRSALTTSLKDGLLVLELTELALYGGAGKGQVTVDGRGGVPAVAKSFSLQGVQAQPLLTDAAGFDRLEGTGRIDLSITAQGRSQKAMVEALDGTGAVKFVDGAIRGINLAAMMRNVSTAFMDAGADQAQKTDFAELSGTFRIDRGILTNTDLLLLNPLLRVAGAGTADMPARTVNYRVEPKVVASLEGQGGTAGAKGLSVPVIIEGPWDNLSYRPDLESLVSDVVKDPEQALEGVKDTVEQIQKGGEGGLGGVLEGILGGGSETEGEGESGGGLIPDAGKALKKLFGN